MELLTFVTWPETRVHFHIIRMQKSSSLWNRAPLSVRTAMLSRTSMKQRHKEAPKIMLQEITNIRQENFQLSILFFLFHAANVFSNAMVVHLSVKRFSEAGILLIMGKIMNIIICSCIPFY